MANQEPQLKQDNLYCIIMAGGVGSRFWPMSRQNHPKQFLDVLGTGRTLLQQTVDRFLSVIPINQVYIVTNKAYADLVHMQIPGLTEDQILLEPARRNTAPCIAYATHKIHSKNPEALLVVAPSDHLIINTESFTDKIKLGFDFAGRNDALLTLGIKPVRPDTGYGYIQYKQGPQDGISNYINKVKTFTEKPSPDLAASFISSGEFLWNSGIFVWSSKSFLNALEKYMPETNQIFKEGKPHYYQETEAEFIEKAYAQCTNISVDYGVMEKAPNVFVIPSDFGWSDLGTWGSLYENSTKDDHENVVIGKKVMLYNTENCIINMPKEKLVAIYGLSGCIVAESDGILLICKLDDEQEIRQIVNDVKVTKGENYV